MFFYFSSRYLSSMSLLNEFESLDEEVRELIQNYKHKKATTYEPCTLNNFKECLIGLSEELSLLNINYVFNPHIDLDENVLRPDALVKLINSVWTLLHYYKNISEKADNLLEQNHILDHNNKQLNAMLGKMKGKLCTEKNESKACVASAQRIADNSDVMLHKLTETRTKLTQLTKKKEAGERALKNEITRLKLENEKLLDRVRTKNAPSCSEGCDMTHHQLKEKEKHQRVVIAKLQRNNQDLLREVLSMKEEIILGGLQHYKIDDAKK